MRFLQENWQILVTVCGLIFSAGIAYASLKDHEKRITNLEQAILVMPKMDAKLDELLNRK